MKKREKKKPATHKESIWKEGSQKGVVFFGAFLLLFLGGLRFNPLSALVISLVDILWIILMVAFFNWLIDRQSFKFKTLNVILIIILLFVLIHVLFLIEYHIWDKLFFTNSAKRLPYAMFKNVMIVFGSFISTLFNYSNKQRKKAEKLAYEKQTMELQFLKSQIKPHSMFNMLNNIYTLAYTKSDQAPEAILKLADMLRYTTDECQADNISIEKELKYIENYIDLYIMRFGHTDYLTFEYDIDDYSARIPPLLLQPIIENSFKYSDIDSNKGAKIFYSLQIKNNHLIFQTYNTKKSAHSSGNPNRKGVGISNIEHRLQLYFKNDYLLNIEDGNDIYRLRMEFDLPKKIENE